MRSRRHPGRAVAAGAVLVIGLAAGSAAAQDCDTPATGSEGAQIIEDNLKARARGQTYPDPERDIEIFSVEGLKFDGCDLTVDAILKVTEPGADPVAGLVRMRSRVRQLTEAEICLDPARPMVATPNTLGTPVLVWVAQQIALPGGCIDRTRREQDVNIPGIPPGGGGGGGRDGAAGGG